LREELGHGIERLLTAGVGITARAIGSVDAASDLTLLQWRLLVLAATSRGMRVGDVAQQLGISAPSASRLVSRTAARGLVSTTRADGDRRASVVRITRVGANLVAAVMRARRRMVKTALAGIDAGAVTSSGVVSDIADRLARFV
jgi:DNA-binding MarR family transcriptional regulator